LIHLNQVISMKRGINSISNGSMREPSKMRKSTFLSGKSYLAKANPPREEKKMDRTTRIAAVKAVFPNQVKKGSLLKR
jgi:hypothetical protein